MFSEAYFELKMECYDRWRDLLCLAHCEELRRPSKRLTKTEIRHVASELGDKVIALREEMLKSTTGEMEGPISVGGIHPETGDFAYVAYRCFNTREEAEAFRREHIVQWPWAGVIEESGGV